LVCRVSAPMMVPGGQCPARHTSPSDSRFNDVMTRIPQWRFPYALFCGYPQNTSCISGSFPTGRSSGPLRPGPPTSPRLGPRCCSPLLMQSTGALANETSQELGGSCANTRDSDIVSTASPPDTIGPCSGGATGGGELRTVLAGPPTISTQGNSTIPSGRGWAIGGCSSSAIRPAGHRSGASRTNSRISGSSAARRSRAAVSPG